MGAADGPASSSAPPDDAACRGFSRFHTLLGRGRLGDVLSDVPAAGAGDEDDSAATFRSGKGAGEVSPRRGVRGGERRRPKLPPNSVLRRWGRSAGGSELEAGATGTSSSGSGGGGPEVLVEAARGGREAPSAAAAPAVAELEEAGFEARADGSGMLADRSFAGTGGAFVPPGRR